ncbi:DsrE family protein [Desulfoluna butyratoxydans]|uniref:Dsrefh-like n=1 Tax=Desulfoluna butyratoxydans TaxID=231438 RepID=A0A4U8YMA3_9BACT|nr:DsrE family protein [Desulfoluna butyratoxydans]VFQ44624.1 dsrefh-like [Desulfoluna butyratoxydans]
MKTMKKCILSVCALALFACAVISPALAGGPDDRDALKGVTSGKAFFDVNLGDAQSMPLYLKVIGMTHQGLVAQGVTPEFVVAFRGPAVQFITGKAHAADDKQALLYGQIADKIRELKAMGVSFEACAIATDLFGVDNGTVLPEVKVVGNTFISLIGYQAQGYGTVPVM